MRFIDKDGKERHKGWIYCYTCVDESLEWYGWDYVGQTRNQKGIEERDRYHLCKTQRKKSLFDRVYQKHQNAFTLDVVDEYVCDTEVELVDILNDREQYYILTFASFRDWGMGFNLLPGGGEKGVSEVTKKKMSEHQKKRYQDINELVKLSKSTKDTWQDPDVRKKRCEGIVNYYKDQENRRKASERMKKRYQDQNELRKLSEMAKEMWSEPGHRKKVEKPCQLLDLESGFVYDFESRNNCADFLCIYNNNLTKYKTKPYKKRWIYLSSTECA